MTQIFRAPYNFVPLANTVYFPDWADQVSHDEPFSDGLCGSFDLVVRAQTRIFTRADGSEGERGAFANLNGEPFLKGSSLRGMLRNVVKIASFGKLNRADDRRFAYRDLTQDDYRDLLGQVEAGWLYPDHTIRPCEYGRVEKAELTALQKRRGNSSWSFEDSITKKYSSWTGDEQVSGEVDGQDTAGSDLIVNLDKSGDPTKRQNGTVVFTGYIPGKKREFFFYDKPEQSPRLDVDDETFRAFEQVHSTSQQRSHLDASGAEPNENWGFWKARLEDDQPIPVFFVRDELNDNDDDDAKADAMGVAMMFRFPSTAGVHDAIDNVSQDHFDATRPDLAELIFGYANDDLEGAESGLKGRVSITHAPLEDGGEELDKETCVLGSPKASFYPAYLQQPNEPTKGNLRTWMNKDARVRGWKRYPARGQVDPNPSTADSDELNTEFRPLEAGTTFRARVYVHNMRPCELGALLWSMNFGDYLPGLVHRFGLAKPYGYGEVLLETERLELLPNRPDQPPPSRADLVEAFELTMTRALAHAGGWVERTQLEYLLAMANPEHGTQKRLRYEPGPDAGNADGFAKAKKANKTFGPPAGIDATRKELDKVAERLRNLEHQREAQRRAALEPVDRAREDIAELSEQDALDWTREKVHKNNGLDGAHDDDDTRREALRLALYEDYYDEWSRGQKRSDVSHGASTLKEYASWLEPPDANGNGGDGEEPEPDSPLDDLPKQEAGKLREAGQHKGQLKTLWHNDIKRSEHWSLPGLDQFVRQAKDMLAPKRKRKPKDQKWFENVKEHVAKRRNAARASADLELDEMT
jgi:CRISPR-associated protein (TIGR03986 family)